MSEAEDPTPLLAIRSAGEKLLLRLEHVAEVLPMLALSGIQEACGDFRGLVNLRGQVLPVHDLSGPEAPLDTDRYIVVTRVDGGLAGLLVDDVLEVTDLPVREQRIGERTVVVAQDGDELVPILEPAAALRGIW